MKNIMHPKVNEKAFEAYRIGTAELRIKLMWWIADRLQETYIRGQLSADLYEAEKRLYD